MRTLFTGPGARADTAAAPIGRPAARPQRLLAGLRALHAAETALAVALRRWPAWAGTLRETEEQLRRLEHAFALLEESPAGAELAGLGVLGTALRALRPETAAIRQVQDLAAGHYDALRGLAHAAEHYAIARLLDLTLHEKLARARALSAMDG